MEEVVRSIRHKIDYAANVIQEHRNKAQWDLRNAVNEQQRNAVRERKLHNPDKTPPETDLGVYLEELDPQVQDAMLALYQKGYTTLTAGFWGNDAHQHLDMENRLSPEITKQLQATGVKVREQQQWDVVGTALDFWPKEADLAKIKQQWDNIATVLPSTREQVRPQAERLTARNIHMRKKLEEIAGEQQGKARVKQHLRLFRK